MKKILIISGLFCFLVGNGLIAQNINTITDVVEAVEKEESQGKAYGKAKSLGNRVSSMEARIEKAKVKLAEHREKGTMSLELIEEKEQKIAALEEKIKEQKSSLDSVINSPKPGKGKSDKADKDKTKGKSEGKGNSDKVDKDNTKGKPEGVGKPDKADKDKTKGKPEGVGKPNRDLEGDDEGEEENDNDEDDGDKKGKGKGKGKNPKAKGHNK